MSQKQRVARAVYGVFVLGIAVFVISSISQVAGAVFGERAGEAAVSDARVPKVGRACGDAIALEIRAIDEAKVASETEQDPEAARIRYARERHASADTPSSPGRVCAGDPRHAEALAALARLDRTAETHAVREARELSPVRLEAQSFISGHPR